MNKAISVNIKFTHLLFMSVLHVHFSQLISIASFSHSFSLSLIIMFIDVIISFILTSVTFRYSLFISFTFVISFIFAFKKIDLIIFRFRIHLENEIIEIIFMKIFDYQNAENKNFNVYQDENLNFQLLIKRLTKKKFLMQSNL